ncbi:MAG: TatD family deoxyribonuclease [Nanoarchaeota archaeon]|nr:MAG: TatD family deoxyribonuclease [Nanoarchaeota archaeon]
MYADVHAHLDDKWFAEDIDDVIKRAENAGVKAIIQNGLNQKTNEKSIELSKKYKIIKPALGIYPSETGKDIDAVCDFIKKHKKIVCAIGEVGLDKTYENFDKQKGIFSRMISLAKELNKPISVHSRKAEKETIEQLESEGAKKVHLHCFMGNLEIAKKAIKLGYSFSIPCTIIKGSHFQELVKLVPLKQLLTETDSPYLGVERGKRNEPANIPQIVEKIAEIKGLELEDAKNILFMNYQQLFG